MKFLDPKEVEGWLEGPNGRFPEDHRWALEQFVRAMADQPVGDSVNLWVQNRAVARLLVKAMEQ